MSTGLGMVISGITSLIAVIYLARALKQRKGCSRNQCKWQWEGKCHHSCPFVDNDGYCASCEFKGDEYD